MTHLFDISGKLALVTGSSRGLGYALATGLAQAGCRLIIHGRDAVALERARAELTEQYGVEVTVCRFDVTDPAAVEEGVAKLIAEVGVPDILVNNAGIQRRAPFTEMTTSDWDDVIATNLSSPFYVARLIARGMAERGSGKIVNIGSVVTVLARQTLSPYTAAKAGVAMLSKVMAADLSRFNIQVNTLSPGYFKTEMNTALVNDPVFDSWVKGRTPAGRWGEPSELVGTLHYLVSPASDFVTGQNILVDGGMTSVL